MNDKVKYNPRKYVDVTRKDYRHNYFIPVEPADPRKDMERFYKDKLNRLKRAPYPTIDKSDLERIDKFNEIQNIRYRPASIETPTKRGTLDRVFDAASTGQYMVMGGLLGAMRDDETVLGNIWEGLKAGNPFGKGNADGEFRGTDVLSELDWNPESSSGKIAKGVTGFLLDVSLDPLTYLSGGGSALARGTGKSAKALIPELGTKATPEKVAELITKERNAKGFGGVLPSDEEIKHIADWYNKAIGIDKVGRDVTLGTRKKHITLLPNDKLAKLGDATVSPVFYKTRDFVMGSTLAKKFSNNANLYSTLMKTPELGTGFILLEQLGKKAASNMVSAKISLESKTLAELHGLSAYDNKKINEALENPSVVNTLIKKNSGELRDTPEGKAIIKDLTKQIQDKSPAFQLKNKLDNNIADSKSVINQLRQNKEFIAKLEANLPEYRKTKDPSLLDFHDELKPYATNYAKSSEDMVSLGNEIKKADKAIKGLDKEIKFIEDTMMQTSWGFTDEALSTSLSKALDSRDEAIRVRDEATAVRESLKSTRRAIQSAITATANSSVKEALQRIDELGATQARLADEYLYLERQVELTPDFMKRCDEFLELSAHTADASAIESYVSAMYKITDNAEIDKKIEWLFNTYREMGLSEVAMGKLGSEQFRKMTARGYVPHILTKEGKEFIEKQMKEGELKELKTLPTDEFGFSKIYNQFAKSRNVHGSIAEINEHYYKEYGIKMLEENVAELFLHRASVHTDLVYDNEVGTMLMRTMGTTPKFASDGFTVLPKDGHQLVIKYDVLNRRVNARAKSLFDKEWDNIGAKIHYDMYGVIPNFKTKMKYFQDSKDHWYEMACKEFDIPVDTVRGQKKPLVGLTSDQFNKIVIRGKDGRINPYDQTVHHIKDVPDSIVGRYNQQAEILAMRDKHDMIALWDKITHIIKLNQTVTSIGWQVNNNSSNAVLTWMAHGVDAFNPKYRGIAKDIAKHGRDSKFMDEIAFDNVTWRQLYVEASNLGILDNSYFGKDGQAYDKSNGLIKFFIDKSKNPEAHRGKLIEISKKLDPTNTAGNIVYKAGSDVGGVIEGKARFLNYFLARKSGMNHMESVEAVNKFLFDYSDVTLFEAQVMKRLIPFYTYLRKSFPLAVDQLLNNRNRFINPYKFFESIENSIPEDERMEDNWKPDWMRDRYQLPFQNSKGEYVFLDPKNPMNAIGNMNPSDILGRANPMLTIPFEQAIDKNMYFGSSISEANYKSPEWFNRLDHVLSKNAIYNAGKSLFGTPFDPNNVDEFGEGVFNQTSGMKMGTYDPKFMADLEKDKFYKSLEEPSVTRQLGELITGIPGSSYNLLANVVNKNKPDASKYDGAWTPLTTSEYNRLSQGDKLKYTPPTDKEGLAYHREAVKMAEDEYNKSGKIKKYVWGLFDAPTNMYGTVSKVEDGDTFKMQVGDRVETVRILLVDTPETKKKGKSAMPYANEAHRYTREALLGNNVKVEFKGRDKYGRVLGYVEVDGEDFNETLVKEGYGQYRYSTDDSFKNMKMIMNEGIAAMGNKGVWDEPGYATPFVDDDYKFKSIQTYNRR